MEKRSIKILFWLTAVACITPLIYSANFFYSFASVRAYYFQILVEAALPFYVYLLLSSRSFRPDPKYLLTRAILAYFFVSLVSAVLGVNFSQSFWGLPNRTTGIFNLAHFILFYFYLLMLTQALPDLALKIRRYVIWVAGLCSFYGLWVVAGLPGLFKDAYWPPRVTGFFGNPIFFASFLAIPLFLTIQQGLKEPRRGKKFFYFFLALLEVAAIYYTRTRATYLGLFAGLIAGCLIYLFLNTNEKLRKYKAPALVGLILTITLAGFLALPRLRLTDNDSMARIVQWKTALRGFKQAPILGVGPENYYFYADKYFDPEIYKYDASWFDKPHNFQLEILVTTGIIGLLAYLGILAAAIAALYKVYKAGRLDLAGLSLMSAGLVAYEVQNFFGFDTISALLTFFVFLGLTGIYSEKNPGPQATKIPLASAAYAKLGLWLVGIAVIFIIYLGNLVPAKANFYAFKGLGIIENNPKSAREFFKKSIDGNLAAPTLEDIGAVYNRIVQTDIKNMDKPLRLGLIDDGIEVIEKATSDEGNKTNSWFELGNMYFLKASFDKTDTDSLKKSVNAANLAKKLAPNRAEPYLLSAKQKALADDPGGLNSDLDIFFRLIPDDPASAWYQQFSNKSDLLVALDEFIKYYSGKQDLQKVINLYLEEIKISPADAKIYARLAAAYAASGDKVKARATAQKVLELNPDAKEEVEKFLNSLK